MRLVSFSFHVAHLANFCTIADVFFIFLAEQYLGYKNKTTGYISSGTYSYTLLTNAVNRVDIRGKDMVQLKMIE